MTVCSTTPWRAIARWWSSTATAASATAGCCPRGPLRETRSRLAVADAIVVNGGRALLEGALSMRLEARSAVALAGGRVSPLDAFAGVAVHAVAGIGNPERFFNMLRAHGIEVEGHPLADHARIAPQDVLFGGRSARAHDREGCRKMRRLRPMSGIGTCR